MTDLNDPGDAGPPAGDASAGGPVADYHPLVEGSLRGGDTFSSVYNAQTGSRGNLVKGYQHEPGSRTAQPPSTDAPVELLPPTIHGRRDLQEELVAALARPDGRLRVLHGIGGGGKSALALWLAKQARNQGREVYWIRNADVTQAMLTVAERRGVDADEVHRARNNWRQGQDLVWRSLDAASQPWLLVFDNIDNIREPGVLAASGGGRLDGTGWVRPSLAGLVVVTSRRGDRATWGDSTTLHPVTPLGKDMGAKVLRELAQCAGPPGDAELLAERLGGLPLALRLAGCYLAAKPFRHRTFAEYRDAIEHDVALLDRGEPTPPVADDEESARRSVMLTWELSLRLLADMGLEPARPLLQLLSCYGAPHPIRLELTVAEHLAGSPVDCGDEPLEQPYLDQVIRNLISVALVDRVGLQPSSADEQRGEIDCVALHPLVAEVIAASLDGSEHRDAIWTAAQASLYACSPGDPSDPNLWWRWATLPAVHSALLTGMPGHLTGPLGLAIEDGSRCAVHLLVGGALQASHDMTQLVLGRGADVPGNHPARLRARLTAAVVNETEGNIASVPDELAALLADAEQWCGPDDPFLVEIRQHLAATLFTIGRSDEAEELYDALRADHDRGVAPDLVLSTRFGYAQLMAQRSQFEIAEREMTIVLDDERERLGPEHPATLVTRALLADIWAGRGRLREARQELEAVLRAQEKLFGPDSPTTLATRVTLMGVQSILRDEGAAETQLDKLLRIQRDTLNPEHPLALLGLATLINARASGAGSDSDSRTDERRLRDVCGVMARTFGADHPLVLITRLSAAIQRHQHDPAGAEAEAEEILDRQTELHGEGHPATLNTRLLHAQMLVERNDDKATAEAELRSLHEVQIRSLGRDHPQTVPVLTALANITSRNGDLRASEDYLREALTSLERLPGPDHAETQETRSTLVSVLCALEDYHGAERELLVLIGSVDRTEGAESLEALATQVMLAMLRAETDRADQAERDLRAALEVLLRVHGELEYGTMVVRALLADLLRKRSELSEAEDLLRAALTGLEQEFGEDDEDALWVRIELGELLHDRDRFSEAERHLQLALGRLQRKHGADHADARWAARSLAAVAGELDGQPQPELLPAPPEPATKPQSELDPAPEPDPAPEAQSDHDYQLAGVWEPVPRTPIPDAQTVLGRAVAPDTDVSPGAIPKRGEPHLLRVETLRRLAVHRRDQGRLDESERDLREALELLVGTVGDRLPDTDHARLDLARLLWARGSLDSAQQLMAAVLATCGEALDAAIWWELRADLAELDRERVMTPRADTGLRALLAEQQAQVEREARGGPADLAMVRTHHRYALAIADRGFPSVAYVELRVVVGAYLRLSSVEDRWLFRARLDAAMVQPDREERGGAAAEVDVVHQVVEERLGPEHDLTLRARRGRAQAQLARGAHDEAATELQEVLHVRERLSASPDREKATVRHHLAVALHEQGELMRAQELHRIAVTELAGLVGAGHPQVLLARAELAAVHRDLGGGAARSELGLVLGAQRRLRGDHHPDVAVTHHHLGIALANADDPPGARHELGLAVDIRTRRLGANHPATRASQAVLDRL